MLLIGSRKTLAISFLLWAVATLLEASILAAQEDLLFWYALWNSAIRYAILALLAIPVWKVCSWLSKSQRRLRVRVGVHLALAIIIPALWEGIYFGLLYLQLGPDIAGDVIRSSGLWQVLYTFLTYLLLVVSITAIHTSKRLETQRRKEAELQLLAREAELRALKVQYRPHFLFNVFNSIYSLIETKPKDAQEMVGRVADLMRRTLDASETETVPIEWELSLIGSYLEIERVRLGHRLRFEVSADGAPKDAAIPPFLVQSIVENSIKHAIAPFPEGGSVAVHVRCVDQRLDIAVADSGPGMPEASESKPESYGLAIVRRRLQATFGPAYRLEFQNIMPRGLEVHINVPLVRIGAQPHGTI